MPLRISGTRTRPWPPRPSRASSACRAMTPSCSPAPTSTARRWSAPPRPPANRRASSPTPSPPNSARSGFGNGVTVTYGTSLALLAARAEVGAALGDDHPEDRCPAGGTRLAGALVEAGAELEEALAAFGVDVIGDGRSSGGDGLGEHGDDGVVEFAGAVASNALGERLRMNAGAEEGLIGVDIADAAHEGLVEQQALDARFMPSEGGGEFVERDFQRFGPEAGDATREVFAELDGAELAAVVEQQGGTVEGEDGVGVFAGIGAQQEAAGHAEVYGQIAATPDGGHDELAVALDRQDAAALQAGGQPGGIAPAEDA